MWVARFYFFIAYSCFSISAFQRFTGVSYSSYSVSYHL